jgi:hypothetical protein
MTTKEHGGLCVYLDEWLFIWSALSKNMRAKGNREYAKLVSDTLSDLLVIDAKEAGL